MNPRLCLVPHTRKVNGTWTRGGETQVEIVTTVNGRLEIKLRCSNCRWLTGAIPDLTARAWGLDKLEGRIYRDNSTTVECIVLTCSSTLIEYHHFAPRNTFGEEADDWPILPVCRDHHTEWHTRMDGYQWHRKRSA
jgi:hypothetical protein